MLTRFADFDTTFRVFDELRRRMDRLWDEFDSPSTDAGVPASPSATAGWPLVNLYDDGSKLVLLAEVPGVSEKDLHVSVANGTLTVSGERRIETPQGYSAHRLERPAVTFARTFALPCKVDAEQTTAAVKDGVLTIKLAKAPEAQPRQIDVRSN